MGGIFLLFFELLGLEELGSKNFQSLLLVLGLAASVLALDLDPGGQVGDLDGGVGCVDVLSARSA